MRLPAVLALLLLTLLLAAACGENGGGGGNGTAEPTDGTPSGGSQVIPVPGNSEIVIGPNRFAIGLLDPDNRPILADSGTTVRMRFLYQGEVKAEQDAVFVWAIPDVNGFWTATADFDQAGQWEGEAVVTRDGEEAKTGFIFEVFAGSEIPMVGDPAPASDNLTVASEPNIKRITTDENPEPALYRMTVAEALRAGKPLVFVVATPAFCQTRFCGPVVDNVKEVRAQFADRVNFVHVEPFELDAEGQLVQAAGGGPTPVQAMADWHLQTEPWVFVMDANGVVTARFEGAASVDELRSAIEAALG